MANTLGTYKLSNGWTVDVETNGVVIEDANGKRLLDASMIAANDYRRARFFDTETVTWNNDGKGKYNDAAVATSWQNKEPPKPADHPDIIIAALKDTAAQFAGSKDMLFEGNAGISVWTVAIIVPTSKRASIYSDYIDVLTKAGYSLYNTYVESTGTRLNFLKSKKPTTC